MRKLEEFRHLPGAHCGSTALNNVARFYGLALTEPLCLGIGEGLGFALIALPEASPSYFIGGRSPDLERRFFENLGVPFAWEEKDDNARAWQAAKGSVDRGIPVLLRTDLHYLPYYASKTHFAGHVVVLVGYDDARGVALLSDTHFPDLQEVSLADLAKARTSREGLPVVLRNHAFPVQPFTMPPDRGALYRRAIVGQAERMLGGRDRGPVKTGTRAMKYLAESFPAWEEAPDWQWCARFAYQLIEKRGTGGGNFRKLYASFLAQAAPDLPGLDLDLRAAEMKEIAGRWTALAGTLKATSEADRPAGFREAGRIMGGIAAREQDFFAAAAAIGR